MKIQWHGEVTSGDVFCREILELWSSLQPNIFDKLGHRVIQIHFHSHSHCKRIFTLTIAGENHPKTSNVLAMPETSRHLWYLWEEASQQWWVGSGSSWCSILCQASWCMFQLQWCCAWSVNPWVLEECAEVQHDHWNSTYGVGNHLVRKNLGAVSVIGASLSEPHTSVTALQVACTCMYVPYREAIYWKFKLNERIQRCTYISNLHTC